MKSSQRDAVAAAGRRVAAATPSLFPRSPLSAVGLLGQRVDGQATRFWYYVAPQIEGDAWGVMFEGQPQNYRYESQAEALKAACRAADAMHRRHHAAAGVRVRVGDDWRDAVKFGAPPGGDDRSLQ